MYVRGFISVDTLLALALISTLAIMLAHIPRSKINIFNALGSAQSIQNTPSVNDIQNPYRCFGNFNFKAIDIPQTAYITHVWQQGPILIASYDSTQGSDDDIRMYKKSSSWKQIAAYNFGPGTQAFDVVGEGILVGNTSVNNHIGYFEFDTQGQLVLVNTINLPRSRATSTPIIRSILHVGSGYVAIGTEKWDGPELTLVRIDSSKNISIINTFEIGAVVTDIITNNNFIIVGTGAVQEVFLLSGIAEGSFEIKDSISFPGYATHDAMSLSWLSTSTFAVGRSVGGFNVIHEPELAIVDIEQGELWVKETYDVGASVYGVRSYSTSTASVSEPYTLATNKISFGVRDLLGANRVSSTMRAPAISLSTCNGRYHTGNHI